MPSPDEERPAGPPLFPESVVDVDHEPLSGQTAVLAAVVEPVGSPVGPLAEIAVPANNEPRNQTPDPVPSYQHLLPEPPVWNGAVASPPMLPAGRAQLGGMGAPPAFGGFAPIEGEHAQTSPAGESSAAGLGGDGAGDDGRPRRSWWRPLLAGVLLGGLIGSVSALGTAQYLSNDRESRSVGGLLAGSDITVSKLLEQVGPSVVSIQVGDVRDVDVFGGSGTGFVISKDGLILTNAHVVNGAQRIKVGFADGKLLEAKLVGSIPDNDVAIIRLTEVPGRLTVAALGSSEDAVVGDSVVAIGNALNLGASPSVTVGIISATGRSITAQGVSLSKLIQTDAAVNPGNSGGPLVNASGEVIGVVTAIASDGQNIGFALSIDQVKPLIEDIKEGRSVINPNTAFLGVRTSAVDELTLGEREALDVAAGAVVVMVVEGSAAQEAGLLRGDVIVSADGGAIERPEQLGAAVRKHKVGDVMTLDVVSGAGTRTVKVKLGRTGG